jgi:hypothetical protein
VIEMQAQADVGIQQIVGPVGVRHPIIEEDMSPSEPQRVAQALGINRALRGRHVWIWVPNAREEEPDLRPASSQLGNGTHSRHRIEPFPQTATPVDHAVREAHAWDHAFERPPAHGRRLVREAKGDDVD